MAPAGLPVKTLTLTGSVSLGMFHMERGKEIDWEKSKICIHHDDRENSGHSSLRWGVYGPVEETDPCLDTDDSEWAGLGQGNCSR